MGEGNAKARAMREARLGMDVVLVSQAPRCSEPMRLLVQLYDPGRVQPACGWQT